MAKRDQTREHSFDELAKGTADGTLSRSRALKVGGTAFLGGVLSFFTLPSRDADAAKGRLLKTLWAVVDAEGNLVRAKGATSSVRYTKGIYEVSFNRDISNCAYGATSSGGYAFNYFGQGSAPNSVTVNSVGLNENLDRPFHLQVTC